MLNLHYTRPVVGMAYTCQDHNKSGEKKKNFVKHLYITKDAIPCNTK